MGAHFRLVKFAQPCMRRDGEFRQGAGIPSPEPSIPPPVFSGRYPSAATPWRSCPAASQAGCIFQWQRPATPWRKTIPPQTGSRRKRENHGRQGLNNLTRSVNGDNDSPTPAGGCVARQSRSVPACPLVVFPNIVPVKRVRPGTSRMAIPDARGAR